ncbi:MAG: LptF/LptG family permease [Phycisphaeraceae bacterium]
MKTLDRYIIRHFLINFAILLAVLMLLYMLVDLIVDLDEFLDAGRKWSEQYGGSVPATLAIVADYYGPMLVLLYVFFSGLLVMGAMGFALAGMQRSGELTAMAASGISLYRVAAPMIVAGIALNALSLPVQEMVIPELATKLTRSKSDVEHRHAENFPVHFVPDEEGNLLAAREFDVQSEDLLGVNVLLREPSGRQVAQIRAPRAEWDPYAEGWRLEEGRLYRLGLDPGAPEGVSFFPTELAPTVLMARRASLYSQLLPMSELQQMQDNPALSGRQQGQITRTIWSRFSQLVMNVLLLVMGLPFFLQLGQANMLSQSVKAAGVCLGAWGMGLVMLQSGAGWLNPATTAWLPVVIYLPVAAILLQWVRT